MTRYHALLAAWPLLFLSCTPAAPEPPPQDDAAEADWISLFNGRDLDDWIVKIAGHELGDNYGNTFRVEDGLLKVSYDQYDQFDRQFGSLFYKDPFSHYRLRVEYRFVGEQAAGGPVWGLRDSGVQMHSPAPETMTMEQEFPISVEVNLIGGTGSGDRPTGNVCTPGTHVVVDDELFTENCGATSTRTIHGDEWVTIEAEVRGGSSIKHIVNGEVVAAYEQPQLDEASPDARRLLASGADKMLREGYISLQSNSHPIEFRKIEILLLDPDE